MDPLAHIVLAGSSQEDGEDNQESAYDNVGEDEADINDQDEDEEVLELEEIPSHMHKVFINY